MQNFPPENTGKVFLFSLSCSINQATEPKIINHAAAVQELRLREDLTGKQQKLTLAFF